jgi:hypothetical protein
VVVPTIYVEGGGQPVKRLRPECRRGFSEFIRKAGFDHMMPKIVACGPRNDAFDSFKTAVGQGKPAILLVDSEDPLCDESPRRHLELRDRWSFPNEVDDEQVHLMVQCMENWFLADPGALASFFGQGFRVAALPRNPSVEQVSKADVLAGLERATAAVGSKGSYAKGAHSFKILAILDPEQVKKAAPHAARLLTYLHQTLAPDQHAQ